MSSASSATTTRSSRRATAWAASHGACAGARRTPEIDGGEAQTCSWDDGHYVNVGAWRIPHSHTGILGYCRELGVPMQVFLNEADASSFYYEGTAAGPLANRRVKLREVKADLIGQVNELLIKAIDQHQLDLPLTTDDQKRLTDFLVRQGYLDAKTRTYKAFKDRGEGDPIQLAALLESGFGNRLRSVPPMEGTAAAPMFQPIGGMDQICQGFQRAIGPRRLTFNAEIQSVHQSAAGVKVVYRDTRNGKTTEVAADYVVACMPLSVMSGIDINLSDEMMQAVKRVTYSNSAKIGLAMKRRFWGETGIASSAAIFIRTCPLASSRIRRMTTSRRRACCSASTRMDPSAT